MCVVTDVRKVGDLKLCKIAARETCERVLTAIVNQTREIWLQSYLNVLYEIFVSQQLQRWRPHEVFWARFKAVRICTRVSTYFKKCDNKTSDNSDLYLQFNATKTLLSRLGCDLRTFAYGLTVTSLQTALCFSAMNVQRRHTADSNITIFVRVCVYVDGKMFHVFALTLKSEGRLRHSVQCIPYVTFNYIRLVLYLAFLFFSLDFRVAL